MLGISIIKTSELNRLKKVDKNFREKMGDKNIEINHLKEKVRTLENRVERLTPKRGEGGKFVLKKKVDYVSSL